jgi:hypothetical protein
MQGGEGDCFYVVGNGEFEVLAIQVIILKCIYYVRKCKSNRGYNQEYERKPKSGKITWAQHDDQF